MGLKESKTKDMLETKEGRIRGFSDFCVRNPIPEKEITLNQFFINNFDQLIQQDLIIRSKRIDGYSSINNSEKIQYKTIHTTTGG